MLGRTGVLFAALALAAACAEEAAPAAHVLWDPGAGELGVFPDDAFTVDDPGAITGQRLDVPPERFALLDAVPETYRQIFRDLSVLDGFGVTAKMFVRFDAPLDPATLWSGEATADWGAPIVLVVEAAGGARPWPYELALTDDDATVVLAPMVPLPPASRAYLAVTARVGTADGTPLAPGPAMRAALRGDAGDPWAARVAPRMAAAADAFVAAGGAASADELAAVVVFTTQSIFEGSFAVAADIAARDVAPSPGIECATETLWVRCEGFVDAVDYRGADGWIDDAPVAGDSYALPFTVWLPLSPPGAYGGDAYPTLVYGHGLGGGREQGSRLAEFAAPRGIATIAVDALRHGDHPTATSRSALVRTLDFFGISTEGLTFEPLRMRAHFRQSTYDKLQLVRMLERGLDVDGDGAVDLDPDRLMYLGVSLGGIMGAELLALSPSLRAGVLIVPGGRVSSIVQDAAQFSLIIDFMRPDDATDGDVDRFFPVLQTMLDRGDAAAWASYLLAPIADRPAGFPAVEPHLLMAMVLDDDTVPNSANRALARALGVPVVPPVRQDVGVVATTGPAPVSGNWPDGRTVGLLQLDVIEDGVPATHSNVGASDIGAATWFEFIDSYLTTSTPVIVDPYGTLE